MRSEHPPYWFWRLDRWKLLLAALLALLALLFGLRGCRAPQAVAPVLTAPAAGAVLVEGALGNVKGTTAPGATVRFFAGDTLLGETIADADGAFRFALPMLQPGEQALTAATFDRNGIRLATSPARTFTVLAAARAPAVVPTLELDAGQTALATGQPWVAAGTAAPAAKVQLFAGDSLLADTTAGANGRWTLGAPALARGAHTLVVRATDANGASAESAPVVVMVTPVVVAPGFTLPEGGLALTAGTPGATLAGTAGPGATVQIFDGDTLLGEAVAGPDGRWQFVLPGLAAGSHTLAARVTGPDGVVTSEPVVVEVAARPVVAPGFTLPEGGLALTAGTPGVTLAGTAGPGATVRIFDGDTLLGEAVAGPDGRWQFVLPGLAAGSHTLTARVTGPDGVVAGAQVVVEVAAGPAVAPGIDVPADGFALTAETPGATLAGTAGPGATVQIFDGDTLLGEAVAGPDGRWQFALPGLAAGSHTLVARVTGPDGVLAGEPVVVEVAPRPVVAPGIDVPADGFALTAEMPGATLAGTSAPGATVQIFDGDALLGEAVAGPDGRWQFALPGLAAGSHTLVARVTGPDGVLAGEPVQVTVGLADYPAPYRVTLAPNESITVPVAGFCLNYGLPFPGPSLQVADALPEVVRKALAYAARKGYVDSDPWQTNLAVWYLAEDRRLVGQNDTIADEIIRFAQGGAPAPELGLDLPSLYAARMSGTVQATLSDYTGQQPGSTAFSGTGALVLRNLTPQTQELLIPWGTRFRDVSRSGVQDMAVLPLPQTPVP